MKRSLCLLFVLALPWPAAAQEIPRRMSTPVDTWSEPNPGLRFLRRTYDEPRISVHALVADLSREGVRVITTPQDERWGTVSDFAHAHEAAAAVNGGFWGMWQRPSGVTAGGGEGWSTSEPSEEFGHFAVLRSGRAVVRGPGEGESERELSAITDAVSGRPILVRRGRVDTEGLDAFESANYRQPRTAIGVSRDGRRVYVVVADGRQDHSRGLTLYQLARQLIELGAWRAINLDGGGSSTMFVRQAGGVVSSPSPGRWVRMLGLDAPRTRRVRTVDGEREVFVRGVEREVMTHVAVIAPPPAHAVEVRGRGSVLADGWTPGRGEPTALSRPAAEPLRLGRAREVLYPALYVGGGAIALILLLLWIRRRIRTARAAPRGPSGTSRRLARSSRT